MGGKSMVAFDLDTVKRVLTEAAMHTHEGTCEFCNFPDRKLSDVGGVLVCDKCRNTITARIKESNHPFVEVRVTMNPQFCGPGPAGERRRLPQAGPIPERLAQPLFEELKAYYRKYLFDPDPQKPPRYGDFWG